MSKLIRIGTRDSKLALWQAKIVQSQIEHLGHKTVLVPVKSTGDIVLDNAAGSGTTGIVCTNTNRRFILIEKEEKYYKTIMRRLVMADPVMRRSLTWSMMFENLVA